MSVARSRHFHTVVSSQTVVSGESITEVFLGEALPKIVRFTADPLAIVSLDTKVILPLRWLHYWASVWTHDQGWKSWVRPPMAELRGLPVLGIWVLFLVCSSLVSASFVFSWLIYLSLVSSSSVSSSESRFVPSTLSKVRLTVFDTKEITFLAIYFVHLLECNFRL